MPDDLLSAHRDAWLKKPTLRAVYQALYADIAAEIRPGKTLEIGGGTGNFKSFAPDVTSSDIQYADWLDVVCDAHDLPFADASYDNIILFDVFHHLERPRLFLAEALRALKPGGRVVMVEPAITPVSRIFYTYFHPEDVEMTDDPLAEGARDPNRDPYQSNQAIPTLLFRRQTSRLGAAFPDLALKRCAYRSLLAYPLSGGFRKWTLVPAFLVPVLLGIEAVLMPVLGSLMAFRLLVVLEKR